MEEVPDNSDVFRQDLQGESSSANRHDETRQVLAGMPLDGTAKEVSSCNRTHQLSSRPPPPPFSPPINLDQQHQQSQQQLQDRDILVHGKILFNEPNQQQQEGVQHTEATFTNIPIVSQAEMGGNEGLDGTILQGHVQKAIDDGIVQAVEEAREEARTLVKLDEHKTAAKKSEEASVTPPAIRETSENEVDVVNKNENTKSEANPPVTIDILSERTKIAHGAQVTRKKAPKRPRAKPGFGLRTSRTTIVETGQKRRSCICTNSKLCNELMTRWAKVSPPDYHYVQLPREHNHHFIDSGAHNSGVVVPGKNRVSTNRPGDSSHNNDGNTNMSDTDVYKNGFRYATLSNIQAKNPLPKDERVALCHYHPEVRPYLFWPKNTPSAQKYAIPVSLAIQLGYDTVANKCQGFNTEKYCYAVPTYSFEDAKEEIGSVEKAFNDRVSQIKTNPTQFVRDLRQCEEELKEIHKLRRRNTELLRRLDDRRRTIKRLKSVLKVQRQERPQGPTVQQQQQQLVVQVASTNAQGHAVSNNTTIPQQYQQHPYQPTPTYHQQQPLADPSQQQQQQQATAIPQPMGQQNHNQFFQPPPPTQEQQAIGIVVGGLTQNTEHQRQHEQQHHWAYTQYNPNAIGGPSGTENVQQHSQQQVQLPGVHPYDPTQHQQQPVPSPMDDHNNPGNSFSYAQQLEAAMAAAVAAGFKDDQEDVDHHQHHGDIVGDVVNLDDLEPHDGFGGDHGEDDDIEDDDWSDTEQYRQHTSGGTSQNQQPRPRKWPRKTVVLPVVSTGEVEGFPQKSKRSSCKKLSMNSRKRVKMTKSVATKAKKSDSTTEGMTARDTSSIPSGGS